MLRIPAGHDIIKDNGITVYGGGWFVHNYGIFMFMAYLWYKRTEVVIRGMAENERKNGRDSIEGIDGIDGRDGRDTADEVRLAEGLLPLLQRLMLLLERSRLVELAEILDRWQVVLWRSLLAGIGRGMGFALGFWLLSALALYLLNVLAKLGIPVLGDFIAGLMVYVDSVRMSYR